MATVTVSRFSNALEENSFDGKGIKAFEQAYAATSALTLVDAFEQHVCYAQLTGAMTINATVSALKQFSKVYFHLGTDGTQRIVTLGTGFQASGTVTIPANKSAILQGVFNGTTIDIVSREIHA